MSADQTIGASSTRVVHIVDATQGPLVGDGRMRRMLPFAVTATVGTLIALPATSWAHPGVAIAGTIIIAATIVGALLCPWHRIPRTAQLLPALFFLAATLLIASATANGIRSPFFTLAVVPLMWLAIYENRIAVLSGVALAATAIWIAARSAGVDPPANASLSTAVFFVCATGMGITLQRLVADARCLAHALDDQRLSLEQAATMLDALPERVNRYGVSDHVITYCNAAWATQYATDPVAAIGRPLDEFLSEDELAGLHSQLAILGPDNPILKDSVAREVKNAPGQWLEWVDRYMTGPDGAYVLSVGRDVTERRDAEIKLAESELQFRDLADNSADVVWRFLDEPAPHFDYMSPAVEHILGYPPQYFLDDFTRFLDIISEDDRSAVLNAIGGNLVLTRFDFHFRHADGSIVIGETRASPIEGGLQGVSRDVTELRTLQQSLAELALHDPLTGLANRRLLFELIDSELARTERDSLPLAVAFLDLDSFKHVNDEHGHEAGDLILCETARRLLNTVRSADTVARIGGDEFVIVFQPSEPTSQKFIERVEDALSDPIAISATETVTCHASIGIADTRVVGYDCAALLAGADHAMYRVKRTRPVTETNDG